MTLTIVILLVVAGLLTFRWLHGVDLSEFDRGYPKPIAGDPPSDAVHDVVREVEALSAQSKGGLPTPEKVRALRVALDEFGKRRELASEFRVSSAGEPGGEWVLAGHSDAALRLLYIHGGGFIAGSPSSHRNITSALAELTGMSVFSLDYRLLPEYPRPAALEDCVAAFTWLAAYGPDGPSVAEKIVIAGDSAGGNYTLATLQTLRDRGLRQADAAVAICPSTDVTLRSPSLRYNRDSDLMLGKSFGALLKIPAPVRHLMFAAGGRQSPASPTLSPLRGDLSGLPPVLLQASLTEMLLDDTARYYHRAEQAGSPVRFETYANMVHVWHLFYPDLPEACTAMEQICAFLEQTCCRGSHPPVPDVGAA